MKRKVLLSLVVTMSLVFLFSVANDSFAGPKHLKFGSYISKDHPVNFSYTWFGEEFEKRTEGRYKVDIYYSGALGKAKELVDLCGSGAVDVIFCAIGYTPEKFILSRGFESIYVTENPNAWGKAIWETYNTFKPVKEEWEEKNNIILAFPSGVDNNTIMSKKLIRNVQDIKGMKLRSYGAVGKMVRLLGGEPVSIAYPETYDAINRGVIDGATGLAYISTWASKLWEVTPHIVSFGCGVYGMTFTAISKNTYDKLPSKDRMIMNQLRREAAVKHDQFVAEENRKITENFLKNNIKLINWSADDKKIARNICVPKVWEAWLEEAKSKGMPADEFLEKYRTLVRKYESYPTIAFEDPFDYFDKM
jgi:TRAP-type C4-dicarboxylate transport system substrate-binding protein